MSESKIREEKQKQIQEKYKELLALVGEVNNGEVKIGLGICLMEKEIEGKKFTGTVFLYHAEDDQYTHTLADMGLVAEGMDFIIQRQKQRVAAYQQNHKKNGLSQ